MPGWLKQLFSSSDYSDSEKTREAITLNTVLLVSILFVVIAAIIHASTLSPDLKFAFEISSFIGAGLIINFYVRNLNQAYKQSSQNEKQLAQSNRELQSICASLEHEVEKSTAEILQQQKYYQAMVQNSPIAVATINSDHKVVSLNPAFEQLFGYSRVEAMGSDIDGLINTKDNQAQAIGFTQRVLEGETVHYTRQRLRKDGSLVDVEIFGVPVFVGDHQIEVLALYHDVTRQKKSEAKVQRLLSQQVAVNRLALELGESRDLEKVYKTIHYHVSELMDVSSLFVSFFERETQLLHAGYVICDGIVQDTASLPPIPLEPPGMGTQSRVIHSGEPYNIPDLRRAMLTSSVEYHVSGEDGTIVEGPPPDDDDLEISRSALHVPMKIEGVTIGVMQVQSYHLDAYTQDDIDLLSALASQAAIAIENARLHGQAQEEIAVRKQAEDRLRKKTYQQDRLISTARNLTESLDAKEVLRRIGMGARQILEAHGCSIYLLEPESKTLTPVVSVNPPYDEEILATPLDVENSLTGQAVITRHSLIFNHPAASNIGMQIPGTPEDYEERLIVVPLIGDDEVLGVMCLNRIGLVFNQEDLILAETFAAYASSALKNAQAHDKLLREVEERTLAEEALRNSEKRYRTLFDNAGDAIFVHDSRGQLLDTNRLACERLGYSQDELLSMNLTNIDSPEYAELFPERMKQLLERGHHIFETAHVAKDGSIIPIELSTSIIEHGGKPSILGIARDISDRKRHQREQETFVTVATALRSARTRVEMIPIILHQTQDLLQASGAALSMLDPHRGDTVCELAVGSAASMSGKRTPAGEGVAGQIIKSGKPYQTNNAKRDGFTAEVSPISDSQACAGVPLIAKEETIGALVISRSSEMSETDIRMLSAIGEIAANAIHRSTLFEDLERSNIELETAYNTTLEGWAYALELRDQETEGHTRRVTDMTLQLAKIIGVEADMLEHVWRGALLHDIGKMGIPDSILLKPGALTGTEWEVMRQHPVYAFNMLAPIPFLRPALDIPYCHHEKWDGTGYPRGLNGMDIPLTAQIFAVVDVWDALLSDRPYRLAWSLEKTRRYISEQSSVHFAPSIVKAFWELLKNS